MIPFYLISRAFVAIGGKTTRFLEENLSEGQEREQGKGGMAKFAETMETGGRTRRE